MWNQKNTTIQCIYKTEAEPTDTENDLVVTTVGAGMRDTGLTDMNCYIQK